jgi:hypothetical protein
MFPLWGPCIRAQRMSPAFSTAGFSGEPHTQKYVPVPGSAVGPSSAACGYLQAFIAHKRVGSGAGAAAGAGVGAFLHNEGGAGVGMLSAPAGAGARGALDAVAGTGSASISLESWAPEPYEPVAFLTSEGLSLANAHTVRCVLPRPCVARFVTIK